MKKNEPLEIYVGSVNINFSKVDIQLDGSGVATDFKSDGSTVLHLNIDEESWGVMVSDLIHELMESCLFKSGNRYHRTDLAYDMEPISCVFVINHDEFQKCCHECGTAFTKIMPVLFKVFNEQKKKRESKKK